MREATSEFRFLDPGTLVDRALRLVPADDCTVQTGLDAVPAYRFKMKVVGRRGEAGRIELRIGNTERILNYLGHIGYRVYPRFRGHRYAARACKLLLPLARLHGLETLWITCDPDNWASRTTCELVGAELVEIIDVPKRLVVCEQAQPRKCRYRLDL